MSTVQEIRAAIAQLSPREQALLTAELVAGAETPEWEAVEAALQAGLSDMAAGRVRPLADVKALLAEW